VRNRLIWRRTDCCEHGNEGADISEHLSDNICGILTGRPEIRYVAVQPFCICSVTVFTIEIQGEVFQFHSCSDVRENANIIFYLLFCMGVKLGLSH